MQSPALHYLTHWATGGFYNGTKETNMKWLLNFLYKAMDSIFTSKVDVIAEFISEDRNIYADELAETLVRQDPKFAKDLKDYLEQQL